MQLVAGFSILRWGPTWQLFPRGRGLVEARLGLRHWFPTCACRNRFLYLALLRERPRLGPYVYKNYSPVTGNLTSNFPRHYSKRVLITSVAACHLQLPVRARHTHHAPFKLAARPHRSAGLPMAVAPGRAPARPLAEKRNLASVCVC